MHPSRHQRQLVVFGVIALWAFTGPFFGFSDAWKIVLGLFTIFVTFLFVVARENRPRDPLASVLSASGAQERDRLLGALDDVELAELQDRLDVARDDVARARRAARTVSRPGDPA
jgi:low affinity Fe/Cu permease